MPLLGCSYLTCIHASLFIIHLCCLSRSVVQCKACLLSFLSGGLGRVQDKLSMDKHSWQALVFFQWRSHVYLGGGEINAAWAVSVKLKEGEMHVGNNNLQKNKAPRATAVPCPACFPCPKQNLRTDVSLLAQALPARRDESWGSWGAWAPLPEPWDRSCQLQVSVASRSFLPLPTYSVTLGPRSPGGSEVQHVFRVIKLSLQK